MKLRVRLRLFLLIVTMASCALAMAQSYLHTLPNKESFVLLSGEPLSEKYTNMQAVKIVYDIGSQQVHFISNKKYPFHHSFCMYELKDNTPLNAFNEQNYGDGASRKYLLGNLNYIAENREWFLEIAPSDLMSAAQIKAFWKIVVEAVKFDATIDFALNTQRLMALKADLEQVIEVVTAEEIHGAQPYQVVSEGVAKGILKRVIDLEREWHTLNDSHIVVLDHTPLALPNVAGVLVTEHQTPLSHLSILGKNRGFPVGVYTMALSDTAVTRLFNKPVELWVKDQEVTMTEVMDYEYQPTVRKAIKLKFDTTETKLWALGALRRKQAKVYGNKAAYLGEVSRVANQYGFRVPENGFAIPFYYYQKHVEASGVDVKIAFLLANKEELQADSVSALLAEIRRDLRAFELDASLKEMVISKAQNEGKFLRLRFRSSTNAEDAKGFSGAGLYDSKTGIIGHENKTIDKAIKKVWASLWNDAAFLERELYGIDHSQVFMGVLVHRSFPDEHANGVAITTNLYRPENNGYVVNVQAGELSVVTPDSGVTCDQLVIYPEQEKNLFSTNGTVEVIAQSSLNKQGLVLTSEQLNDLASALFEIKQHFYYTPVGFGLYNNFAMDVEFKFDGPDQALYIKQARIYPQ